MFKDFKVDANKLPNEFKEHRNKFMNVFQENISKQLNEIWNPDQDTKMGINKEIEVLKKSQTEIKLEIKNKTNQTKLSNESLLKAWILYKADCGAI